MREQLESLSSLTINFGTGGMMIVNFILAFVMFGVALGIKTETFKDVFKNPKSVIIGLLLQWIGLQVKLGSFPFVDSRHLPRCADQRNRLSFSYLKGSSCFCYHGGIGEGIRFNDRTLEFDACYHHCSNHYYR